jgi:hypothetical protein
MDDAIFKSGGDDDAIPYGLWDALAAIKGFDEDILLTTMLILLTIQRGKSVHDA